jgi:hypothetical protein
MYTFARMAVVALISLGASAVNAQTITTGCSFQWDWTGDEALLDGFNFYVDDKAAVPVDSADRGLTCTEAGVEIGAHVAKVTAFNAVGETTPSNEVNFTFVLGVPSAPTVLRLVIGQ